jgi:hypothetical protein
MDFCKFHALKYLFTPKSKSKRAVNSRARQNKTPASSLGAKPSTINWNVNAQRAPRFLNTIARDNKTYTVMQTSNQGVVLQSQTALFQVATKAWTTSDILQFNAYSAVFDQYRIDAVEVWLTPFGPGTIGGYNLATRLYSVVDYDDASAPTSLAALQQYENCVETRCTDGHYIKFRPHIAVAAFGGAFTQFLNKPSDWIDSGSTATQHYGVKLGVEPTTGTGDVKVDMVTRLTVSFRNVF